MKEKIDRYIEVIPQRKLAEMGSRFLTNASVQYPASAICQGAQIALLCREAKVHPYVLESSFLQDSELLEQLRQRGNDIHRRKGVKSQYGGTRYIFHDEIPDLVRTDFGFAARFEVLDTSQLHEFLTNYSTDGVRNEELGLRAMARSLIEKKIEEKRAIPKKRIVKNLLKFTSHRKSTT